MPSELWLFLLFGGVCLSSCLMGRPNCFVFPSHRFCPSSLTQRTWKAEKVLANVHLAAPAAGNPGGSQERGPPTHMLQQHLLPHGLHQALGVHVAQTQDVQGAAIFGAGPSKWRTKGKQNYILLHNPSYILYMYNQFLLFAVVNFYKVTSNTESRNSEPLLLRGGIGG